jgi:sugar phosphate isomerase/epimerase
MNHHSSVTACLSRRRRFIRQIAGTALAMPILAALPGIASAAVAPQWRMKLAFSSVMFGEMTFEEVCERAAKLGFEAIDIWPPFDKCRHLEDIVNRLGPDGLKELLAKHKLKLGAFSVYNASFPKYAEFIGKFGGGIVVRESAYGKFEPAELTAQMKSFFEKLKPQIEQAAQANALLAIENHGNALLSTPDSFKAFVDLNPAPKIVGIALAPYHLQSIKVSVEDAIATCGAQLRFFYAWQNAPSFNQLPGHGPTDFTPWLKALAKINYPYWVNPFMHGHAAPEEMAAAVAKSCDYLKQCHRQTLSR